MNEDEQETSLNNQNWMKQKGLIIYYGLALGITSLCWLSTTIIASATGYVLPGPFTFVELLQNGFVDGTHVLLSVIFSLGVYGPLVGSVFVTYRELGRSGLNDLARKSIKWRVSAKWYLLIIIIPFIIGLPAILMGIVGGWPLPPSLELVVLFQSLIPFILWQLFTSGLEEPGWRGYALPKLQEKYNAESASMRLGILWSIWHWPLLIFLYATTTVLPSDISPDMAGVVIGVVIVQYLFLHAVSTAGVTIIFTWFYNNTGSIFLCILFHVMNNVVTIYVQMIFTHPAVSFVFGIMPWVIAFVLVRYYGKETLTGKSQEL
ncbi:MAG: CPBP family intramembrane glutamic endopeptidase [Candidatus Hodarchaeales archaeon]|jgi:membrane protease YdiL (CAAX protease family)